MKPRTLLAIASLVLILTACDGGDTSATTAQTTTADDTTHTPTTAPPETTTTGGPERAYTHIQDLVYLSENGRQLELDVYAPAGDGPFPVAILLHGIPSSKSDPQQSTTAAAAAQAGMLTFVPNWNPTPSGAPGVADLRTAFATTACALAYAEQEAASYGGDPSRVVTSGFSAGALEAAWLALGHQVQLADGCVATDAPHRPVGAVLGDSEYFLHSAYFDAGFDSDLDGMLQIVGEIVDPDHWPDDLSATFRIWYAENSTRIRPFDDAWAADGWLAQRDPDGSIRDDLDALGLLTDGIVSFIDESELLAHRLQRAGLDATVHMHPGGHTMLDKTDEMVTYLLDAAGAG